MGNALQMTKLLKDTDATSFAKHRLYATWANCMVQSPPPEADLLKVAAPEQRPPGSPSIRMPTHRTACSCADRPLRLTARRSSTKRGRC